MRSFLLLLKIQVLGMFGLNRALHARPGRTRTRLALASAGIVVLCAIVALYVVMLSLGLVQAGAAEVVALLFVEAGALCGACASFPKASGLLFSFRDYDLVMSLPIGRMGVMLSRVASLYSMAVALCALIVVPSLAVLAWCGAVGVGPAALVGIGALVVVLAPVIPVTLAIALAALVAAASTRFRRANVVMGVLGMLLVVVFVVGSFALGSMGTGSPLDLDGLGAAGQDVLSAGVGMGELRVGQLASLGGVLELYAPAAWASRAITEGDAGALLLFVCVSLAVGVALVAVLVRVFVPINEALRASRPHAAFTFDAAGWGEAPSVGSRGLRARRPLLALAGKELRLLVSTPVYLLNSCMGYVLALVVGVVLLAGSLTGTLDDAIPAEYLPLVVDALPWVLAFCLGISSPASASMSLEGASRWLMQSAPVGAATVLASKALPGLVLTAAMSLVGGVLCALALGAEAVQAVALVVAPLAMGTFSTLVGLALDSWRPRFDWTTPYEPVKRGFAVMVTVLAGVLVSMAGLALSALFGWVATLGVALVVAGVSLVAFWRTLRRPLPA